MSGITREAVVRFRVPGFHRWPEAAAKRQYLAARHRHVFHVEFVMTINHDDREVEFHDLLDVVQSALPAPEPFEITDFGRMSTEEIAGMMLAGVADVYPGRAMTCSVFEDGENGARIHWPATNGQS